MTHGYSIVRAESRHLDALPAIELAAAQLLQGHAPEQVLLETTSLAAFAHAAAAGRLWVALCGDVPVGLALVEMLTNDLPHLEEVDVEPSHGRRGVGTALVRTVCDWASANGYAMLTLTTFRDVAWNMPFYAKLGFAELSRACLRPELSALVAGEAARGLAIDRRVAMSYDSGPTVRRAMPSDAETLFDVWLRSARATHTFVSDADLASFAPLVREYVASPESELWVLSTASGTVMGFMGLKASRIESLFLAPEFHRRGGGRRLVDHAKSLSRELRVDVNEQNADAVRFYEARGFVVEGRSELDDNGRPYPLLHMRLAPIEFTGRRNDEIAAFLADKIYEFNSRATGMFDGEEFAAVMRDDDGRIIAGVNGHTWGGCCYVLQLWVDETRRRRGLGRLLMAATDAHARRKNCSQIALSSHSFQAPEFYRRLGFVEVGRMAGYPRGYSDLLFVKQLDVSAAAETRPDVVGSFGI